MELLITLWFCYNFLSCQRRLSTKIIVLLPQLAELAEKQTERVCKTKQKTMTTLNVLELIILSKFQIISLAQFLKSE